MGRLPKLQIAQTLSIIASTVLVWGGTWGLFFPKIFCTFWTRRLDILVAPVPIIQTILIIGGCIMLILDSALLPDSWIIRHALSRTVLQISMMPFAFIHYQTTDATVLLLISVVLRIWHMCAIDEKEMVETEHQIKEVV